MVHEPPLRVSLPFGLAPLAVMWMFLGVLPIVMLVLIELLFGKSSWSWPTNSLVLTALGIFTASCLTLGFGLLSLKRWAWYLGLIASGGLLALFAVDQVQARQQYNSSWSDLAFDGLITCFYVTTIWFLFRRRIRALFHIGSRPGDREKAKK